MTWWEMQRTEPGWSRWQRRRESKSSSTESRRERSSKDGECWGSTREDPGKKNITSATAYYQRVFALTGLKSRRSWRRQRRRKKRRRKGNRRKNKRKGNYLRFKTCKWWVWGRLNADGQMMTSIQQLLQLQPYTVHRMIPVSVVRSCHTTRNGVPSVTKNSTRNPRPWRNWRLSERKKRTKQVGVFSTRPWWLTQKSWRLLSVVSSRTSGQTSAAENQRGLLRRWRGRGGRWRQVLGQKRPEFPFVLVWRWRVSFCSWRFCDFTDRRLFVDQAAFVLILQKRRNSAEVAARLITGGAQQNPSVQTQAGTLVPHALLC